MPFAPAADLAERFSVSMVRVLSLHDVDAAFIDHEVAEIQNSRYAPTASRSVVGVMNELAFMAGRQRDAGRYADLDVQSVGLSRVPHSSLRRRHEFADLEVQAVVSEHRA